MRFTCTNCGKRYVVNDPVLPDRVYRLRCKACGTIIPIKAGMVQGSAGSEAPGTGIPLPSEPRGGRTPGPQAIPPPAQRAPTAAASTRQAAPASPPPGAPAQAARYIDLFDGEDLNSLTSEPPSVPAWPTEGMAPTTAPAPARPPLANEPDPFAAANAAFAQPEPPSAPPPPPARPQEQTRELPDPAKPRKRIGTPLAVGIAAAASGVVLTLLALSLFRPSGPASSERASQPRPGTEAPAPVASRPAPPPPAAPPQQPAPAAPAPDVATPSADAAARTARAEEEKQAQAEKLERERQAQLEKERLAREEKERLAREEKERLEKERLAKLEKERLAKLEKERLAREEKDRLAREEKERLKAEKAEKERVRREKALAAKAAPAAPTATARAAVVPPPAQPAAEAAAAVAPPAPSGGRVLAVEFTGVRSARGGSDVSDTVYSQNPNDARITDRSFANGLLTFTGQVGYGGGSTYAGIGLNVNVHPDGKPMDASRFTTMTIKLAGSGVRSLRIRLIGAESTTRNNGCYPIAIQRVSEDAKEYAIRLSEFVPEGWCGSKGRNAAATLSELVGFEIADTAVDQAPVSFSVGSIYLNP